MEQFKKLIGVTVKNPPSLLDEDEEITIAALVSQARTELDPALADEFANMLEHLRDGSSMFILSGPAILKQMAMIFDFGRRYEAIVQNDMRADKEE